MSFKLRLLYRNYRFYTSMAAGVLVGFSWAAKNLSDVRQVVSKDMLEISEDGGTPYIHIERKLQFLSLLPLRTQSRIMGYIAEMEFPAFIMRPLLSTFARKYDVQLDEAVDPDLSNYKSLSSFFNRPIKEACRQIDKNADLISPCDGRVLALGHISSVDARQGHFKVEQVKGVTFSLASFLGTPFTSFPSSKQNSDKGSNSKNSDLFFCTIYLAPGDYHSFITPADWKILKRRHFSGRLFSVKPKVAEIIRPLFTLQERVLYTGLWQHGFFSFTAVGATNVGKINVYFDKDLETNLLKIKRPFVEKEFVETANALFKRGDAFGKFRLGSTIVLIFEAPRSTQFNVQPGQRVFLGQSLTNLTNAKKE